MDHAMHSMHIEVTVPLENIDELLKILGTGLVIMLIFTMLQCSKNLPISYA